MTNFHATYPTGGGQSSASVSFNRFTVQDHSQTLTNVSSKILDANESRSFLIIQNNTSNKVWLDFNVDAQQGFPSLQLNPFQTFVLDGNSMLTNSVYAVTDVVNSPLVIKEG